jgi:hypothetical protein
VLQIRSLYRSSTGGGGTRISSTISMHRISGDFCECCLIGVSRAFQPKHTVPRMIASYKPTSRYLSKSGSP